MRRLGRALLFALVPCALALNACARRPPAPLAELSAELLSDVEVADPRAFEQLVGGFFQVEANAWRWTSPKFTVVLRPPEGAGQDGARLELDFVLPGNHVERLGPVTLSAVVNGYPLAPETYTGRGPQVYAREVPAEVLRAAAVAVEFASDKALPPQGDDPREMAVVASRIALTQTLPKK
jgi:hypothetical protein